MFKKIKPYCNKYNITVLIFLILGCFIRIFGISAMPNGLNCDEASIGYEAYSVLNYGVDRNGDSYPVFLEAWGSGQNALYMYIIMPFIKIFGLSKWSVRFPMALIGCISLIVMYKLLSKTKNKRIALIGLMFLTICPWHIMKSRYGLESNVFPDLTLLAVYVFICGIENKKSYLLYISSIIFGLSSYAYGTSYFFLPVFLIPLLFILIRKRKITIKQSIISLLIVFIVSFPIILMIFINTFDLPKIKIGIFTIPRLEENRYEQLTVLSSGNILTTFISNFIESAKVLILQNDGYCANALPDFGIIYQISLPIALMGLIVSFSKKENIDLVFKMWFISAFLLMFICDPNINRMNIMYFPLIYYTIIGIDYLSREVLKNDVIVALIYMCVFELFIVAYCFTDFTNTFTFEDNIENVIKYMNNLSADTIYFEYAIKEPYIYVLFYNQENTEEFVKTVKYKDNIKTFNSVESFSNYEFKLPEKLDESKNNAYIMTEKTSEKYEIEETKWNKTYRDRFVVIEKIR